MGDFTWSLLKKLKEDVRNLLKAFESTGSLRFSDFSKVWRDAKFSLIFRKRNNFAELLEFCEEILHITKEYLLPAHEFPIRVGALYALYGLYFKQPLEQTAKIRLVKSEWENLSDLIEQCKRENHVDAVFIHFKLFIKQAYLFTATERQVGLELGFRKYFNKKSIALSEIDKLDDLNENPIIEPGILDQLSKIVSLYSKTKSVAAGNSDPQLIDENFSKHLKEQCTSHTKEKIGVREDGSDDEVVHDNNDEDWCDNLEGKQEKSAIGAKRTKLKQKSFASQKKINSGLENETVGENFPTKKPKVSKNLLIAKKKAQVLIKQKELSLSADSQPGQSSAPDIDQGEVESEGESVRTEDNFTLPQL